MLKKYLIPALMLAGAPLFAQRTVEGIDFGWRFHLGELTDLETDSGWVSVDLPHDWSAEGTFAKEYPGSGSEAYLPAGSAWYSYSFDNKKEWKGRRVFVQFDGIFCNATVYVNGSEIGFRPNGYLTQTYDMTEYLQNGVNGLTVHVDNSLQPSSRWYSGSGINRHARFIVTGDVYVPESGIYVTTPEADPNKATVHAEITLASADDADRTVEICSRIVNGNGKPIVYGPTRTIVVKAGKSKPSKNILEEDLTLPNPSLWSPDSPAVYKFVTKITESGKTLDEYTTNFGVRTISFDAENGFLLNGKKERFKGVCLHQNTGPVGSAMPDDLWEKRLKQLKEMGCNAVRTSHYAYAPVFYDLCDSLGLMVMDELFDGWYQWKGNGKAKYDYGYYFLDWWKTDLEDFIRRDRNHPSVMIWSMGNEVWGWEKHLDLQQEICDMFHRLDPTRPTTQAWCTGDIPDIVGFNGNGEQIDDIEKYHRENPDRVAIGTEMPHTRSTRSVYQTRGSFKIWDKAPNLKPEEIKRRFPLESYSEEEIFNDFDPRYASSYDNQARWIAIRQLWTRTRDLSYYVGDFRWSGYDYLGEAWSWPSRSNNYGVIDMCGFPKDNFYLYQSIWSEEPMVHILPHWTWPGMEGSTIPIVVYTNGDEVELFQDGKSLGRKPVSKDSLEAVWNVVYSKGKLKAVAWKDGAEHAEDAVLTAGEPAAIRFSADRRIIQANRTDLVCIDVDIVDSKGNMVPYASNRIEFKVEGPCKVLGTESGDILDMEPMQSLSRKAFMGKSLIMVQATSEKGIITISAESDGLKGKKTFILAR